jgi:hypothetical protein
MGVEVYHFLNERNVTAMATFVFFLLGLIALLIVIRFLRFLFSGRGENAPEIRSTKQGERRRINVNSSANKGASIAAKAAEDQRRRTAEWARSLNNPANPNSPLHPANPRNLNNPANPLSPFNPMNPNNPSSPMNPSNRNRNR